MFVGTEDSKLLSLRSLIAEGAFTPPVLIFCQSILRAKELSTELLFDGINADCIHAERTPEERDEVVRKFAEGSVWALICTDVMSRGVDFSDVKVRVCVGASRGRVAELSSPQLVINYDFPQSAGSYIHRIGSSPRRAPSFLVLTRRSQVGLVAPARLAAPSPSSPRPMRSTSKGTLL